MSEIIVKPLEWDGDEYVGWTAYGVGLGYSIDDESGEEECFVLTKHDGHSELKSAHASFAAASEFAQAGYESRILSAIDLEATKAEIAAKDVEIERLRASLKNLVASATAFHDAACGHISDSTYDMDGILAEAEADLSVSAIPDALAALNASEREA